MGSKILTLLTSLTLVANSAVAQNQTLTLLDQCQGGDIDVLVSLYNDGCKQNITTVLRYAGLDTAAQCPEAKATLACIKVRNYSGGFRGCMGPAACNQLSYPPLLSYAPTTYCHTPAPLTEIP